MLRSPSVKVTCIYALWALRGSRVLDYTNSASFANVVDSVYQVSGMYIRTKIQRSSLAMAPTGGSGQEVFEISRVGSGRVGSGRVG